MVHFQSHPETIYKFELVIDEEMGSFALCRRNCSKYKCIRSPILFITFWFSISVSINSNFFFLSYKMWIIIKNSFRSSTRQIWTKKNFQRNINVSSNFISYVITECELYLLFYLVWAINLSTTYSQLTLFVRSFSIWIVL